VKTILSVDISNWTEKGIGGKQACECTIEEIKEEVWAQLKKSLNNNGTSVLRDDQLIESYLDSDIQEGGKGKPDIDLEPLLVNTINSWDKRPESYTGIPNLFLASDYVRTYTDLATMEGANEAARRAVNNILDTSGSREKLCEVWNLHEPFIFKGLRAHDQMRYNKGLPWRFHETLLMKMAALGFKVVHRVIRLFRNAKPQSR
jgi:hypothetical protein